MSAKHAETIKKSTSLRTSARSFTPLPSVRMCPHLTKPPPPVSADVLYGRPLISCRKKDKLYLKYRKCPTEANKIKYRLYRNKFKMLRIKAEKMYYEKEFNPFTVHLELSRPARMWPSPCIPSYLVLRYKSRL